jgi:glyoxylase-like metal-dependent hydrolase (beta-lactamase superfamily II)
MVQLIKPLIILAAAAAHASEGPSTMAAKPFASSADTEAKQQTLEVLADGVYALTAEGDPNVGAIEGEDFLVAFEALATPAAARDWLALLREHTDKPVRYLVLSHYHAVRVLGASAFDADIILTHEKTHELIRERGKEDWASEFGRMPRLAKDPDSVPGLTWPTQTFADRTTIDLGGDRGELVLSYFGRGHTEGDIVAWLPQRRILFAGDLVEAEAALYTGDAFHHDWAGPTLDAVAALEAEMLVGGRGTVTRGRDQVDAAIAQTRGFLTTMIREVGAVHECGGTLKEAFTAAHAALEGAYGHWPIFEHCLPFDVSRLWDEFSGIERPVIWTAERDREVWDRLQD